MSNVAIVRGLGMGVWMGLRQMSGCLARAHAPETSYPRNGVIPSCLLERYSLIEVPIGDVKVLSKNMAN